MRQFIDDSYPLSYLSGHTTEDAAWQMLEEIASSILKQEDYSTVSSSRVKYSGNFYLQAGSYGDDILSFTAPKNNNDEASVVWSLGATTFYMLLGVEPFDGRGGRSQTAETVIPVISRKYASPALSNLVARCMNYEPGERPTLNEIIGTARYNMTEMVKNKRHAPRVRLHTLTGKGYVNSLIDFWPEEMVRCLILTFIILHTSLFPALAQNITQPYDMRDFTALAVSMRNAKSTTAMELKFQKNSKWTMMDELVVDRKGECTIKDQVKTFGFNKVACRIAARRGGITTTNDRFRDGRDKRYKYSIIEITVKKGHSVSYDMPDRKGVQTFAVIPYNKSLAASSFPVSMTLNGKPEQCSKEYTSDGVLYLQTTTALTNSNNKLKITIANKSTANQAFILINHNPQK